ncbi:hypothetical protein ES705_03826 [subsurface metagenome]
MSDTISPELREKIDLVVEKAIVRLIEKASKDQSLEALIKALIVEKVMSRLKPLMNRYIARKLVERRVDKMWERHRDRLMAKIRALK